MNHEFPSYDESQALSAHEMDELWTLFREIHEAWGSDASRPEDSDSAADLFARDFYAAILSGQSISESLLTARSTLFTANEADWVNYIHYGDAAFKVKIG